MPFVGIGLHVLIALFFAIHAVRSGQQLYWLIILFMFPAFGSIVYFVVVYLPDSRLQSGARRAVAVAARTLDPTRELREARAAFEYTPTAQNQMRLAAALLASGAAEEAATNYEACLKGPFASDLEIQLLAARAFLDSGRGGRAVERLQAIRQADAGFRAEQVSLLLARALQADGRSAEAAAEFETAHRQYGSFDVLGEYDLFARATGDEATAARQRAEIDQMTSRWSRHNRDLNSDLLRRLATARSAAIRS